MLLNSLSKHSKMVMKAGWKRWVLKRKRENLIQILEQSKSNNVIFRFVKESTEKKITLNNQIARKQKELENTQEERSKMISHFEEINGK